MARALELSTQFLGAVFHKRAIPIPGDKLWVSMHTAAPQGVQDSSEVDYPGYKRVPVTRNADGWVIEGLQAANADMLSFPMVKEGGPFLITHFGIGTDADGEGRLLYQGALGFTLQINRGIVPFFEPGTLVVIERT